MISNNNTKSKPIQFTIIRDKEQAANSHIERAETSETLTFLVLNDHEALNFNVPFQCSFRKLV